MRYIPRDSKEYQERILPLLLDGLKAKEKAKGAADLAWMRSIGGGESATADDQPLDAPSSPVNLLASWREILVALGLRNNREDKSKVSRLNKTYGGPIAIPGMGKQPLVEKPALLKWWSGLAAKVQAEQDRRRDAAATASRRYNYGREGEVAPDISGNVKQRRSDRNP